MKNPSHIMIYPYLGKYVLITTKSGKNNEAIKILKDKGESYVHGELWNFDKGINSLPRDYRYILDRFEEVSLEDIKGLGNKNVALEPKT